VQVPNAGDNLLEEAVSNFIKHVKKHSKVSESSEKEVIPIVQN